MCRLVFDWQFSRFVFQAKVRLLSWATDLILTGSARTTENDGTVNSTIYFLAISVFVSIAHPRTVFDQWPFFSTSPIYAGQPIPIGPPFPIGPPVYYQQPQPIVSWVGAATQQSMRPATVSNWLQQPTTFISPVSTWQSNYGQPSPRPVTVYRLIYQSQIVSLQNRKTPGFIPYSYATPDVEKQVQARLDEIDNKVNYIIQEMINKP